MEADHAYNIPNQVCTMTGYGARPVAIDMARGRTLSQPEEPPTIEPLPVPLASLPLNHQVVADRLSLAHWRRGHQIVICSLAGGAGRTTVAGLMATVLAELPFAHHWPPIAVVEAAPRTLSATARRWQQPALELAPESATSETGPGSAVSGARILTSLPVQRQRRDYSVVVVDAPAGLPSDLDLVAADPTASVVLISRPDVTSLAEVAEALVWMNDHALLARRRVSVVINHGAGRAESGTKAAATALGIRCAATHSLPQDRALAPGRTLPSGQALSARLRRPIARISLDIWTHAYTLSPAATSGHNQQEQP